MAKNPAFPFYAQDFLVDVSEWTAEEVGVYIRLLATQWANGDLSSDPKRLAISGGPEVLRVWETVRTKFLVTGDRMVNEKLEKIRAEKNFYLSKQSEAGRRGASKRWQKNSNPNGEPNSESVAFKNEDEEEKEEEVVKGKEEGVQGEHKKKTIKPDASEYTKGMEIYDQFIRRQTGSPAKIDAVQGKALKEILAYFGKLESVQNKEATTSECLARVLENWDKLDQFTSERIKLTDINSGLINIIKKIKSYAHTGTQNRGNLSTLAGFFRDQKLANG